MPPCYVYGFKGYRANLQGFARSIRDFADQHQTGLFRLPDVVVAEGCVALQNLGMPFAFESDGTQWGYVAGIDESPLRFMLSHLLSKITKASGVLAHAESGVCYDLGPYIDPQMSGSQTWSPVLDIRVERHSTPVASSG